MPVGIAGHGLLLSPHCPCRVAHLENGTLLVQPIVGAAAGKLPPVAAVGVGSHGDTTQPTRVEDAPMPTWSYGKGAPRISLGNGATSIEQVFARVDVVPGDSPWTLLGPGFWIEFPARFTLDSARAGEGPFFQLTQEGDVTDAIITFAARPVPAPALKFSGPNNVEGTLETEAGSIRMCTHSYEHDGVSWRARYYALPLAVDATLVMTAQAPRATIDHMFASADRMAASFAPMRSRG